MLTKAFWNILRKVSLGKDEGRDIQNLVVDGNEPHDQDVRSYCGIINQYFTTIALSILDGRTIDRNSQRKETISRTFIKLCTQSTRLKILVLTEFLQEH